MVKPLSELTRRIKLLWSGGKWSFVAVAMCLLVNSAWIRLYSSGIFCLIPVLHLLLSIVLFSLAGYFGAKLVKVWRAVH